MENIFFDSWQSLLRTLIVTILAYLTLIIMLRISGKRTLSKMNAFDFIVTIAFGSSLASIALNKNVALADGVLVFLLFILMQYTITWLSVRHKVVKQAITCRPSLLLYKGELYRDVMKKERITIEEIYSAARNNGVNNLDEVNVMVLEATGKITVIKKDSTEVPETISDVTGVNQKGNKDGREEYGSR